MQKIVSGAIKNSSVSDDSSSEMMELEDSALIADPQLENNIRRLREEERLLLEQQAAMEAAGNVDDIAALEHQDLLRLNHLKQQELQKQLAHFAQRQARANANANAGSSLLAIEGPRERSIEPLEHGERTQRVCRSDLNERIDRCDRPDRGELRRRTCNVRVNHLHVASCAEALETDV